MNRSHEYDDELDTPPPPPWWQGLLVTLLFVGFIILCIALFTSCTCTLDGESLVRSIIIYQTSK